MKNFCMQCGTEAKPSDSICTECGTPLKKPEKGPIQKNARAPMNKKNKMIAGIVIFFIALVAGFYMYGSSYASAEKTVERFNQAVVNKDKGKLKEMVEFEGGGKLSDGELDAIIQFGQTESRKFLQTIGPLDNQTEPFLFSYKQSGKVFGVFDGYTFIVPSQYLSLPYSSEELEYKLNGEKMKLTLEDGQAIIGPIAPGIYELKAEYNGEYTAFTQSQQVELLELYEEVVSKTLDVELSDASFALDYSTGIDPTKTKLVIGKKEIAFDKEGKIESIGPFPLDGSVKVKTVSEFPWGEITTEEVEVDENYISINMNGVNKDVEKEIVDTLLAYGEQYTVSRASGNTKDVAMATNNWKKTIQEDIDSERDRYGYFSGQFDELQADFVRAKVTSENDRYQVVVPVSFSLQGVLDEEGKDTELESEVQSCWSELVYVEDEWKVDKCHNDWFAEEVGGTIVEASKKHHKASGVAKAEVAVKAAETAAPKKETASHSKVSHGDLERFMQGYNHASVDAINQNDFSQVSYLIVSGSPREKEQKDYLGYLNSKGITEDHIGTTLKSFKAIDDTTVEVTTKETFDLHYVDKDSARKTFTTVSQLKLVDGEWEMYKLISTK